MRSFAPWAVAADGLDFESLVDDREPYAAEPHFSASTTLLYNSMTPARLTLEFVLYETKKR